MPAPRFSLVEDGQKLMEFLEANENNLPHVVFLDINMPRKNGSECLSEIKSNDKLKNIAVVIYSTSSHENVADILYQSGAHYYVRKSDLHQLEKILKHILNLIVEDQFSRPDRDSFVLHLKKA